MTNIQSQVQKAIEELVESGAERGLQVAVYRHGEQVVDAVAGVADPETGRPVTSDTPFFSYSIGKGVASTVVHVLAERDVLDYDTPISELWPEFGAHGKERATVRHALSQSAGVPGLPAGLTVEDLCDWEKMCEIIAGSEPWWEPGEKIGYHAITWGYIIGEIIRRATGKPIPEVLQEEVGGPLGVANELFFAVPASEQGRLAQLEDAPGSEEMFGELPEDSPIFKLGPDLTAEHANRADVRSANILAGGTVTARAVARMYAALLGEVDGVRLISPERLREVSAVAMSGEDQIFGFPTAWGLGYSIGQFMSNAQETQHVFGVGGVGGSHAYADKESGTTLALTNNLLAADFGTAEQVGGIVTKVVAEG
ncbi:Beta-lactamase class C and other penicillin binding protein (plasmid) [Rubrobacter radiotolerans]|uniref:Beta-lactamase class C and other penicillin binding protein n=1 Tax=Rubrobacter radiotolerans TaxID=42256 RepID=A0A023X750_RUBRA|nr:serine hydrolase domain-containing protein [Rubrobacter radiotolerans]AHY48148.1 Beta-lactamase class C and other penicillin binding protein [Rubrobacter radiotolerans]MDX5895418.1 serine hydrolase domain-containing protein [Rubrobacter radiotolerans]SMC01786.1 CubicO group peptidase, beta-lactamase class C family [Rubrobacter radiotolerans DSM 5868]